MSASFYLNENCYPIYAGTINLCGTDSAGNTTAPIITTSNVVCANLYVEHAQIADSLAGNIVSSNTITALQFISTASLGTPPFVVNSTTTVANLTAESAGTADNATAAYGLTNSSATVDGSSGPAAQPNYYLKSTTPTTMVWAKTPIWSGNGDVMTVTNSASADQILVAANITHGSWQAQSATGNITNGNAFTITNAPVTNYALVATSANTVQWQSQVVDSVHSDWADSANSTANVITVEGGADNQWYYPVLVDGAGNFVPEVNTTANRLRYQGAAGRLNVQDVNVRNTVQIAGNTYTTLIQATEPSGQNQNVVIHDTGSMTAYTLLSTNSGLTVTNAATSGYVLTGTGSSSASWQAAGGISSVVADSIPGTSTATAGGTTTLAQGANIVQVFTGASDQTCKLPDTSQLGLMFIIVNKSSGQLIVANIGGANVDVMTTTGSGTYVATATANVTADWSKIASGGA